MVEIEPHINFFAFLILLGVIQGLILSFFFLNKKNRVYQPNIFIGLWMLAFSLTALDIFLCYTGYMARFAYLDNFSESLTFTIGPLFYLYVVSSIKGPVGNRQLMHLLPFALYAVYNLLYMLQPTGYKLHQYTQAFFPDAKIEPVYPAWNPDPLLLRKYLNEISGLYILVYFVGSFLIIANAFRNEHVSFFIRRYKNLSWLRNFTISLFLMLLLLVVVKLVFGRDLGDYLVISFATLIIYGTSISVISSSAFFTEHLSTDLSAGKKYARSSLSEEDKSDILKRLKEGMENEKYYRNNLISQTLLSKKLLVPTHHISQVMNEKLNQSFFEFIATYRILEAEQLLSDPKCNHMTIEDIAEEVGYNSKSAFNKTFKKITGKTPSEYRV